MSREIRTPGGALANATRSLAKRRSGGTYIVKPQSDSVMRDSLAVVSGTAREIILVFTMGLGAEDCHTGLSGRAKNRISVLTKLRGVLRTRMGT
jgi:hypothetical protein